MADWQADFHTYSWAWDDHKHTSHVWHSQGDFPARTMRQEAARIMGRDPKTRYGDVLGQVHVTPPEKHEDGRQLLPAQVTIEAFYGAVVPSEIKSHVQGMFPEAMVRQAHIVYNKAFALDVIADPAVPQGMQFLWAGINPGHLAAEWAQENLPGGHGSPPVVTRGSERPSVLARVKKVLGVGERPLWDSSELEPGQQYTLFAEGDVPVVITILGVDDYFVQTQRADGTVGGVDKKKFNQWMRRGWVQHLGSWTKEADADMEGVMVALYPSIDVCEELKVRGGEDPGHMHITLLYFEDKAEERDDWDGALRSLETIASEHEVLEGRVGGFGVFKNTDTGEDDVLWATVDVPGLAEFKHEITRSLEIVGFDANKEHGFTPHITLKYGWPRHKAVPHITEPIQLRFEKVSLTQGDKQQFVSFKSS